jgi:predicted transposase/invertase (TIGR01784 family)
MHSDSWFYEVFRQWPDLILHFLGDGKAGHGKEVGYRFEAPVLKEGEQRLDGVLVPQVETAQRPVVILEVQMFADGLFWHRLYAETACYLLQHPSVRHWQAVVLTPRAAMPLGTVDLFAEFLERRVTMVNLEDLSRRQDLEPLEELLTLVVRQEPDLGPTSRRLVAMKPELSAMVATILWKRLPHLSLEEVMTIAGIQLAELSETRAYQDILAKGREEGRQEGREEGLEQGLEEGLEQGGQREASLLVLKQLRRRFGSVTARQEATIRGLTTADLEDLAEALLAFGSPVDLKAWLAK